MKGGNRKERKEGNRKKGEIRRQKLRRPLKKGNTRVENEGEREKFEISEIVERGE